ncbi:MAG: LytR/AlgR family response regulator transcription factor [Clostridium sp.]|uniref:LytR/AlgR family response regulator transcription factor n=1 Tax=Clostridium sp. TaxID=1506 RepID=UPI003D6D7C99
MENDMYHIVICDDEPKILEDLSDIIKAIFSKLNIFVEYYITQDAKSLLEHISETNIDILFLDIDMPKHSGMEVADYLLNQGSKTLLIFVTNYEALVYQSFQYHPFGFIRKNYFSEEIEVVISNAVNVLKDRQDTISIKMNNELIRIKISEIMYFEADSNYVNVFTTTATYYYRESLGVLEKQLSTKGFIRIHRGYLINQRFVYAIRYNEVELSKVGLLPIGRSNRENVRKLLMKYMR